MNTNDKIKSGKLTLVNFHATWCGPYISMKPHLDEVVKRYGNDIEYERIDIDQNQDIVQHLQIRGVPTAMLVKDGEIKWRQSGVLPSSELARAVDQNL